MKRQTTAVRLLSVLAAAFLLLTGAGCAANAGGGKGLMRKLTAAITVTVFFGGMKF